MDPLNPIKDSISHPFHGLWSQARNGYTAAAGDQQAATELNQATDLDGQLAADFRPKKAPAQDADSLPLFNPSTAVHFDGNPFTH